MTGTIWIVFLAIGVILSLINSVRYALIGHRMSGTSDTRVVPAALWLLTALNMLESALEAAG